jgi:glycosyltransferase involved in cell wall biosynthesis
MPTRVLVFHPALAPYRIDLFNELAAAQPTRVVFLEAALHGNALDVDAMRNQLAVEHSFAERGVSVGGRNLGSGYAREIERYAPDVVVTSEFGFATVAVALHRRTSRRPYAHVVWTDDNPESILGDPPRRRLLRDLILQRISGLVTLSAEATELYRTRYGYAGPLASVPILQREQPFRAALAAAGPQAQEIVARHALGGRRVLLYVGRLAPEKGLPAALRAFAVAVRSRPDARLVLVGDGPQRGELLRLATELGVDEQVLLVGHAQRATLHAWLRVAGSLVLPSVQETFGAVINEALLAGLYVGCSRRAGARVLVDEPDDGVLFDPFDPQDSVRAIAACLDATDPVDAGGACAVRPSRMRIGFAESAQAFISLLDRLSAPAQGAA